VAEAANAIISTAEVAELPAKALVGAQLRGSLTPAQRPRPLPVGSGRTNATPPVAGSSSVQRSSPL